MTIHGTAKFTVKHNELDAEQAHSSSDAVKAFVDVLYPRCERQPTFERWQIVD